MFSYDSMGRVLNNSQCTPQNCPGATYPVSYTYDLIGDTITATPGPSVTLTYAYNIAARVTGITSSLNDGNHPGTLVSGVQYNPAGGHLAASLGNGVNETLAYDQRFRLQSLTAVKDTTTVYSFSIAAYAPNSNVLTGNDSVNGNWNYGYDDFNRLCVSNKGGQPQPLLCTSDNNSGQQAFKYIYDRFGNRWQQNVTGGSGTTSSLSFDANNRIIWDPQVGVTYDAAGNVTNDGVHSYTYDAGNRILSVDGGAATYVYNAAGMRVRKTTGGVSVDYLYDLAGNAVAELNTSGAWTRTEVYAGSRHVATYKDGPSGQTYFSHGDWLGTERARTDKNGVVVESCTNQPFGDGQACAGTNVSPLHFTGKQRDTETASVPGGQDGLDYFGARYYVSRHGRWLTPDWSARAEAVPYASLANPQTLNLYAYVGNNPVSATDADGHGWALRWRGGEGIVHRFQEPLDITMATPLMYPGLPGLPLRITIYLPSSAYRLLAAQQQQTQQAQSMALSSKGLEFIKKREGLCLTVCDASGEKHQGDWTIGYGHKILQDENFSEGITEAQALELLKQDVQRFVRAVNAALEVSIAQNQFDALVSFAFNAGERSVSPSNQMMRAVNAGHVTVANFTAYRYITVNGKKEVNQGLINRHTAEYRLYSEGVY